MPRSALILGVIGLLATGAPGVLGAPQLATRPLALDDYYRLVDVRNPAISPDGSRVVFERSVIVEEENRRHTELWIVDRDDASDPRRLTSPGHESRNPRWSPDGTRLAFESDRGGEGSIWFLDLERGGEAFQIEGIDGAPVFSPDGGWIAFTRATPPTGRAAIRTRTGRSRYELETDDEELIRSRFRGRVVDWMGYRFDGRGDRPDPRDPLASPPRELYVVPVTGGTARRLTRLGVDVRDPVWGPDSDRLYFAADEEQRDEHAYERDDLWSVDLTGELVRLTEDGFVNRAPWPTPDGGALVARRVEGLDRIIADGRGRGAPVDLVRFDLESGAMTNLTSDWDLRPGSHRVAPDGSVLFDANVGGQRHLFRTSSRGGAVRQVTEGARWLSGFDFTADHATTVFVGSSVSRPVALFAADLRRGTESRLTRFNDLLASEVRLTGAQRHDIASTDGTPIEGWIMLPAGAADDPVPLILAIHGGPHGAYGERFSFQFQLWVGAGYAVLFTNPRGSTGYGEDFLWATWGGWGNLDYQDVMAAVGTAIERWPVDPSRLGVTGYSYGGFLTNWVITHTDRFVAAISGAGISNWISDYGTADIPRTKESEFFGPPWQERSAELLWQQSPIRHAEGVSTPTLFVHGEADYRVPIEQAEQMYTALQKQRVPARFVRYPDTSHGGWRPWDVVHRYFEEMRWWEQHLGDD